MKFTDEELSDAGVLTPSTIDARYQLAKNIVIKKGKEQIQELNKYIIENILTINLEKGFYYSGELNNYAIDSLEHAGYNLTNRADYQGTNWSIKYIGVNNG